MSARIEEIRTKLEQYQADMVNISKLRLLGLAGELLTIAEEALAGWQCGGPDQKLQEAKTEIAALKLELRALQPDEQMSLLRIAQRERDEAIAELRNWKACEYESQVEHLKAEVRQSRAREEALEARLGRVVRAARACGANEIPEDMIGILPGDLDMENL